MLIVYSPAEAFVKHLFALSELSESYKEPHIGIMQRKFVATSAELLFALFHVVAFSHDARDFQFEDVQLVVKR